MSRATKISIIILIVVATLVVGFKAMFTITPSTKTSVTETSKTVEPH